MRDTTLFFAISGWMALEYARIFRHHLFSFLPRRRRRQRFNRIQSVQKKKKKRQGFLTDCDMIFHEGSSHLDGEEPRACTCSHSNLVVYMCVSSLSLKYE